MTASSPELETANDPWKGGLRQHVMRGGIFLIIRQMLSMMMSLVGVLIITRVLGPGRYGSYAAALGIYVYLQTLGQGGIGVFLVRARTDPTKETYWVASTLLLSIALLSVGCVESSLDYLGSWINITGFKSILSVLLVALPFGSLSLAPRALLERKLDFKRVAAIELGGQLLYYVVATPVVLLTSAGPWALVAGWLTQEIAVCITYHAVTRYLPRMKLNISIAREILAYSGGVTASGWIYLGRNLINPMIVGHYLGAEAVGIISLCIRLVDMLAIVKNIAWRLSVAALAKIQHDPKKLVDAVTHGMQLQILAIAPLLLAFSWVGAFVLPFIFGKRWDGVEDVFPYVAISAMTNSQFNMQSSVLYVLGRNMDMFRFHLVHVALFAAVAWFAVPYMSIIGYGWGEVGGLLGYIVLHREFVSAVGSPNYQISLVWWLATAIGLFWQKLGFWAIAVPFLSLAWPQSFRQIKAYSKIAFGWPKRGTV